jgi:hypothetical protein
LSAGLMINVSVMECTREDNITFKTEIYKSLFLYKTPSQYSVLFLWLFVIKVTNKKTLYQWFPVSQTRQEGKAVHIHAMKAHRRKQWHSVTHS